MARTGTMTRRRAATVARRTALGATVAAGALALGWAGVAAIAWGRYGRRHPRAAAAPLDALMPEFDVHERHETRVAAPAPVTFAAERDASFQRSRLIRGIFAARARIMGAAQDGTVEHRSLLEETQALGWRVLAEVPDRLIVLGAVTKPWEANVVFEGLPDAEAFRRFSKPGYVKIAWTLEAEPLDEHTSIARSETRVATTDGEARRRFRRYWAAFSPGIVLIRREMLRFTKRDAEARAMVH